MRHIFEPSQLNANGWHVMVQQAGYFCLTILYGCWRRRAHGLVDCVSGNLYYCQLMARLPSAQGCHAWLAFSTCLTHALAKTACDRKSNSMKRS
eukprot:scaffold124976_cov53-Prasinocladus_malaysianus.AAC.1